MRIDLSYNLVIEYSKGYFYHKTLFFHGCFRFTVELREIRKISYKLCPCTGIRFSLISIPHQNDKCLTVSQLMLTDFILNSVKLTPGTTESCFST